MSLVSICIPTFNRSKNLQATLLSIERQDSFRSGGSVEVVICDNCSTDQTEAVAIYFQRRYPTKVRYTRNSVHVSADINAVNALKAGSGLFLKAHNDNFCFVDGALDYIVAVIEAVKDGNPVVCFKNAHSTASDEPVLVKETIDEFVEEVSFLSGWLGSFGIWRERLQSTPDFGRLHSKQIFLVDVSSTEDTRTGGDSMQDIDSTHSN